MKNYILIGIVAVIVYLLIKNKKASDTLRAIAGNTQTMLFSASDTQNQSSYTLNSPVAGSGGTVIANAGQPLETQTIEFTGNEIDPESSFDIGN